MSDIQEQVNRQIEAFLATAREEAEATEQSTRAAALNAAAVTMAAILVRYGPTSEVFDLAERYAAWIRTGEDPERIPDLPPVDF